MKKVVFILGIIVIFQSILIIFLLDDPKKIVVADEIKDNDYNSNALTMMLETEAGSGEYALSNSGEWSGEGYTFNPELSRCENGGELSWDSEINRVVMQSNSSDRLRVF